ncbi:sulfatase family protein [Paenibacillus sp. strain BS8-2]
MDKGLTPNVLWISLEDTSPRFGCYGDPLARTPNIDQLASEGCRFPHTFSTAGVCAPSRSAVITGMYPTSIGTMHMRTQHVNPHFPELPTPYSAVLPHYVKVFTEYLRANGYYCTNNEKTDYQFDCPITAWDEVGHEAHWRHRKPGQPFFSVFNPEMTHESGMWLASEAGIQTDCNQVELPPYLPDTPKCREALAKQYDNIAKADERVGQILQQLEEDGLAENTIVFLWSDHGEGLPRAKRWPYDAGIHVPMIVRSPQHLKPGSVDERMVSLVDLAPTVLALTGTQIPWHMQGNVFIGEEATERTYIYATRDRYDESYDRIRAVRDTRYKYIRNYCSEQPYLQWIPYSHQHPIWQEMWRLHQEGSLNETQSLMLQTSRPVEELYDCEQDPHELRNLAQDPSARKELVRLREALDNWMCRVGDLGEQTESEMVERMWPGGKQPRTAPPRLYPIQQEKGAIVPPITNTAQFDQPLYVALISATQGASIAYAVDEGERAQWLLYTGPLFLKNGENQLRAKAIRVGYQESEECVYRLFVQAQQ